MSKNNVYLLLTDTSSGIMKNIGIIRDEDEQRLFSENLSGPIRVEFMRMLTKDTSTISFPEIYPFSSDKETFLMKEKIISFSKSSSSLAATFLDMIEKTSRFSEERNIPYFTNDEIVSIDKLIQ